MSSRSAEDAGAAPQRSLARFSAAAAGSLWEMIVLIDEYLPAALRGTLTAMGHECQTVRRAGFGLRRRE
jgi:hypothetical protein